MKSETYKLNSSQSPQIEVLHQFILKVSNEKCFVFIFLASKGLGFFSTRTMYKMAAETSTGDDLIWLHSPKESIVWALET